MTVAESIAHEQTRYWAATGMTPVEALDALGAPVPGDRHKPGWDDVAGAIAGIYTEFHWGVVV